MVILCLKTFLDIIPYAITTYGDGGGPRVT